MIGSSNVEDSKETLFSFLEKHNAETIINDKIFFKSLDNPNCCYCLEASLSEAPPEEMLHRDRKNFKQDQFKYELKTIIQNESVKCYCELEKVFDDILNK